MVKVDICKYIFICFFLIVSLPLLILLILKLPCLDILSKYLSIPYIYTIMIVIWYFIFYRLWLNRFRSSNINNIFKPLYFNCFVQGFTFISLGFTITVNTLIGYLLYYNNLLIFNEFNQFMNFYAQIGINSVIVGLTLVTASKHECHCDR